VFQLAALAVAIGAACGCGGAAGMSGAPGPSEPVPTEITVSVTATGFKPKDSVVAVGGRARFENVDDRLHSVASNPLISHADCPQINEVGTLVPGQSKLTGVFAEAKTCGYHDPASEGSGQVLMGSITVR
jgi:plastocyanin